MSTTRIDYYDNKKILFLYFKMDNLFFLYETLFNYVKNIVEARESFRCGDLNVQWQPFSAI